VLGPRVIQENKESEMGKNHSDKLAFLRAAALVLISVYGVGVRAEYRNASYNNRNHNNQNFRNNDVGLKRFGNATSIKQNGNQIVEVDGSGDVIQTLFLLGDGRIVGNRNTPSEKAVAELAEVYLQNYDNFRFARNGNARSNFASVDRFLRRYTRFGQINGIRDIDLNFGVDIGGEGLKDIQLSNNPVSEQALRQAALAELLNSVGNPSSDRTVSFNQVSGGRVSGLVQDGIFRPEMLALLTGNYEGGVDGNVNYSTYPYACTGRMRVDWMAYRGLNARNYNALLEIPANLNDPDPNRNLFTRLGVQGNVANADPRDDNATSSIIIDSNDSIISKGPNRIITRVNRNRNLPFRISYDPVKTDQLAADMRNATVGAIKTSVARESLWLNLKGFMAGTLSTIEDEGNNPKVNVATSAPNEVVKKEVRSFTDCLRCHGPGFRGGIKDQAADPKKGYTNFHQQIQDQEGRNLFPETAYARYEAEVRADSEIYMRAKRAAGVDTTRKPAAGEVGPPVAFSAMYELSAKYEEPLTLKQIKAELASAGINNLGPVSETIARAGIRLGEGESQLVDRALWEQKFCEIFAQMGGRSVTSATPRPPSERGDHRVNDAINNQNNRLIRPSSCRNGSCR